jgi:RNase P subunit RPR2
MRKNMLERTCKKCSHVWVIPKKLESATRMGMLGGNLMWAATMASEKTRFDTCPQCGSVRYYSERRIK